MKRYIFFFFLFLSTAHGHENTISKYPFPPSHTLEDPFPVENVFILEMKKSLHEAIIERSKTLEQKLKKVIFGQDVAVRETANAIIRFAAGVNDSEMPIASMLYCGPSGVGKTELAKQLCLELYGNANHFIRINMSEYSEQYTITRLIGSPPGYVNNELGGGLSNRLLDCPYSVVLLDEIEKAHPKILKLFMHVFDAGYFTSAMGEDVDCRKAIFILTSNIASSEIADLHQTGYSNEEILEMLKPHLMDILSPEMFNRLDCMIFSPLTDDIFEILVRKILSELKARVAKAKGITIHFDQTLVDYFKTCKLDPRLGARPLKRMVEKELATVLAQAIIDRECKTGDALLCSYLEGSIILDVVLSSDE